MERAAQDREDRLRWIPVRGDSMWPSLRSGDEAGFVPLADPPSVGEVVIARLRGVLVIHRVIRLQGDAVVLRGDNCEAEDPAVQAEALLGVARSVRRGGRVLGAGEWDVGPRLLGALKVRIGRRLRRVLGRAA